MQNIYLNAYQLVPKGAIMNQNSKLFIDIFNLLTLVPNKKYCRFCFIFRYLFMDKKIIACNKIKIKKNKSLSHSSYKTSIKVR